MKFVIFHGAFGNPESNWFPELKERLEDLGQEVLVPQFPVEIWDNVVKGGKNYQSKIQTLDNWIKVFDPIFKSFKKGEKLVFIGHSLAPLFILHLVDKYNLKLDSAIFVSPFLDKLPRWEFNAVNNTFYEPSSEPSVPRANWDYQKLQKLIPISYVLYSDNDPYVPQKLSKKFADNLGSSQITVKSAGHLNSEVNLNEFPLVFEICKTRLDLSIYQKYLAHRKEIFQVNYIKGKNEEVVYISPDEIYNEGVFKFRNLQKRGFCTFYTALEFWDTQSKYYEEARKAARRIKDFSRVFIVDKLADLEKKVLKEQINLDLESGIKVYLCKIDDVAKELNGNPDFGIWDDEYLCIVQFNNKKEVSRVRISSLKEDLKKAKKWEKKILDKAVRIYNTDKDFENFQK